MDTKRAVAALAALAQETRLSVFRLLVEQGPDGLAAGSIAETLGLPPSSLSFRLAQLGHAGLVLRRRESRSLIYSVDFAAMESLMGFLMENCCGGNVAACMPAFAPALQPPRKRRSA